MSDPAQLFSTTVELLARTVGLSPDGGTFNGVVGTTTPTTANFTFVRESVNPAIIPVGTSRADALQLTSAINISQTTASGTGVVLPLASAVGIGGRVTIFNAGANPMQVYAQGSETLDAGAGSTGVALANTKRCEYIVAGSINWISAQLGAASA